MYIYTYIYIYIYIYIYYIYLLYKTRNYSNYGIPYTIVPTKYVYIPEPMHIYNDYNL